MSSSSKALAVGSMPHRVTSAARLDLQSNVFIILRIRVLLGLIRVYFSKGEMRGRKIPLAGRGKTKAVLGGRRRR